jgi:hypothetical protein
MMPAGDVFVLCLGIERVVENTGPGRLCYLTMMTLRPA